MRYAPFHQSHLQQICNVLGETHEGLTNSEISDLLDRIGVADVGVGESKRVRILAALKHQQQLDSSGDRVARFVEAALDPVMYHNAAKLFTQRQERLNAVLAFAGYSLAENGRLMLVRPATTLTEAGRRANHLKARLMERGVHGDVLLFCTVELVKENYFHAVLEATKSVAEKVRSRTGLTLDGSDLVDKAFGGARPLLAINTLVTEPERSEQRGFTNLLKGTFGTFRNPTAHAPKIAWKISEEDALDLLTLASYLHRRIDSAARTPWF